MGLELAGAALPVAGNAPGSCGVVAGLGWFAVAILMVLQMESSCWRLMTEVLYIAEMAVVVLARSGPVTTYAMPVIATSRVTRFEIETDISPQQPCIPYVLITMHVRGDNTAECSRQRVSMQDPQRPF